MYIEERKRRGEERRRVKMEEGVRMYKYRKKG